MRTGAVAGVLAAIVNSLAIAATKAVHLKPGTGGLASLVFGHPLGAVGSQVFHLALGTGMGIAYTVLVRRILLGPGWLRGLAFVQVPAVIQLFWVLPETGHGTAGTHLSMATPALAWSLNALFGVTLGFLVERMKSLDERYAPR